MVHFHHCNKTNCGTPEMLHRPHFESRCFKHHKVVLRNHEMKKKEKHAHPSGKYNAKLYKRYIFKTLNFGIHKHIRVQQAQTCDIFIHLILN